MTEPTTYRAIFLLAYMAGLDKNVVGAKFCPNKLQVTKKDIVRHAKVRLHLQVQLVTAEFV